VGSNTINVLVTAQDGVTYQTYVITVTRAAGTTVITALAIPGITVPVTGGTPVTTVGTSAQYTGTVTWNGNPETFAVSTAYTATITLTPATGYTLTGVAANSFTVAGANNVSNAANSGVVTAVFPATAAVGGGGDGGGGGGAISGPSTVAGVTNFPNAVNAQGVLNQSVDAWSNDNNVLVYIPAGATILSTSRAPLNQISITQMTTPPTVPAGAGIIGLAYDFEPSGTNFTPAATIRFSYNPASVPSGVSPNSLQIAYYNTSTSSWVTLTTTEVDTTNHFIYAQISHFTSYALTYGNVAVTAAPTTTNSTTTTSTIPTTTVTTPVITSTTPKITTTSSPTTTSITTSTTSTTSTTTVPTVTNTTATTMQKTNTTSSNSTFPSRYLWLIVMFGVLLVVTIVISIIFLIRKNS
jgi:hypothetical protein